MNNRSSSTERSDTVVFLLSRFDYGGAELRAIELAESMPVRFHFIAVRGGKQQEALTTRIEHAGSSWHLSSESIGGLVNFYMFCKHRKVTAVHSALGFGSGPWMLTAFLAGVGRRISHFHSEGIGGREHFLRRLKIYLSSVLLALFSTKILFASPATQDFVLTRTAAVGKRGEVIANPLAIDALLSQGPDGTFDGFPSDISRPLIAHVGRLLPSKNRCRAISIVRHLQEARGAGTLVLVGPLTHDEASALSSSEHASIHLGTISNVGYLLREVDVLLVTSSREGLPGIVLEALAMGTPVVGSRIPSLADLFNEFDGITLCDLNDSDEVWTDAIVKAISNADSEGIAAGVVESQYSLQTVKRQYAEAWGVI